MSGEDADQFLEEERPGLGESDGRDLTDETAGQSLHPEVVRSEERQPGLAEKILSTISDWERY